MPQVYIGEVHILHEGRKVGGKERFKEGERQERRKGGDVRRVGRRGEGRKSYIERKEGEREER